MNGLRSEVVRLEDIVSLVGSTSDENCLCVANLAGSVFVEYDLVAIDRRLSIGVETR